ncbi:MAG: hypothetical protein CH104c_0490 [Candidatus Woesebacteria bacterium]|nr:MAG: hypothetical protein CH104c_0490 [Candidatus Woesebacteria bacterium]
MMGIGLRIRGEFEQGDNAILGGDDSGSFPTFPTILTLSINPFFLNVKRSNFPI